MEAIVAGLGADCSCEGSNPRLDDPVRLRPPPPALVMLLTEPELPGLAGNCPLKGVPVLPGTLPPNALADGLACA